MKRGEYVISKEDLFQEAAMALYEACLDYDIDSNASFFTFAYTVIKRRIINKYRDFTKPFDYGVISYDANRLYDFILTDNKVANPEEAFYHNELIREMHQKLDTLSNEDQEIVRLRCNDLTYKEIGERLNMSYKKVDNRIYRLRKYLSKYNLSRN